MSIIQSLGYLGVGARNLEEWTAFATGLLGMQAGAPGAPGQLTFRMDERCQRLFVDPGEKAPPLVVGWEVEDTAALEALAGC